MSTAEIILALIKQATIDKPIHTLQIRWVLSDDHKIRIGDTTCRNHITQLKAEPENHNRIISTRYGHYWSDAVEDADAIAARARETIKTGRALIKQGQKLLAASYERKLRNQKIGLGI